MARADFSLAELAGLTVSEDQFIALRACCFGDVRFPETYAQWRRLIDDADTEAAVHGTARGRGAVDVDHFDAWCACAGVLPGLLSLQAYLIVRRNGLEPQLMPRRGLPR